MVVKDVTTEKVIVEFHSSHYGHDSGQSVHEVVVEEVGEASMRETAPQEEEEEGETMYVEETADEASEIKAVGAEQWVRFNPRRIFQK